MVRCVTQGMNHFTIKSAYSFLYLVAFATLLFGANPSHAQRRGGGSIIRAYPVVGATVSQIEGDYLKGFKKWGFTAGVGAQAALDKNERWFLSVEVDFAQRGVNEYVRNSEIPYLISGMTLNYVDIPLTFHFKDPYGGIMLGVGLAYSRLVQQPHGTISFNPAYVVPDTSDMSFLKNDLAVAGDLRFTIWRGLQFNIRMQYSIIPVKESWTFVEHVTANDSEPPLVTTNDCFNFSVSVRLLYLFGGDDNNRYHKSHRRR